MGEFRRLERNASGITVLELCIFIAAFIGFITFFPSLVADTFRASKLENTVAAQLQAFAVVQRPTLAVTSSGQRPLQEDQIKYTFSQILADQEVMQGEKLCLALIRVRDGSAGTVNPGAKKYDSASDDFHLADCTGNPDAALGEAEDMATWKSGQGYFLALYSEDSSRSTLMVKNAMVGQASGESYPETVFPAALPLHPEPPAFIQPPVFDQDPQLPLRPVGDFVGTQNPAFPVNPQQQFHPAVNEQEDFPRAQLNPELVGYDGGSMRDPLAGF